MTGKIPQKIRAQVLWEAGHRTAKSMKRRGGIPVRSAERYIKDLKEGKSLERKPTPSRSNPRNRSNLAKKVIRKVKAKEAQSLRDLANATGVSHTHIKSVLNENGYYVCSTNKNKVRIPEKARQKRRRFAEDMQDRESDWPFVIFSDECSFWLNKSKPNRIWTNKTDNSMEIEGTTTHGPKIHLWGAITSRGPLKLQIFTENLEADDYVAILEQKVLEMRQLFPEGFIFQQDGSGVHRAGETVSFIERNMDDYFIYPEWPPYSPDLSPIENVWAWLKAKVSKDMPKTIAALKKSIKKHWATIDAEFLSPYYETMPNRMVAVIENNGKKIKY